MKNRKRFVSILAGLMAALMILTLILSLLPTRASAASSSEIRKQINELKAQKKDIQAQIEDLKEQYQENENEIADIVARKNIIDRRSVCSTPRSPISRNRFPPSACWWRTSRTSWTMPSPVLSR